MKKILLTLLSVMTLMPAMAGNNVAPWGWALCSDESGAAYALTGGCFTEATTITLQALGNGQADDAQIKQAIAQYDIIIFDGSNGDFTINEYMKISAKNKTLIGINDARLCTEFFLTADHITYLKAQNLEKHSSTDQYTGTLPDGSTETCDKRAFFTKKAVMELMHQDTGDYFLPNKAGIFSIGSEAENIIIRNLSLIGPGAVDIDGADLITNQGQHVWIDHCTFVDAQDGALDSKRCDWATYTYNHFYYTDRSYSHAYTCGCGWAEGQMTLHLTFASNIWGEGCERRLPQCEDCYVHLVNNYYNCPGNSVCIAINDNCNALVENNYAASGVKSPLTGSGSNRNVTASGNSFSGTSIGSTVTVPYQYSKTAAANVPDNLTGEEGAGATMGNDADYILSTISATDRSATSYAITTDDAHVKAGGVINEVGGITLTFSDVEWKVGGSGSDAQEVDGVALTGKYATTSSNGNPVTFTTTKAGTLTIFFGGGIATTKKVFMTEGENGLTGKVLSTDAEVASGTAPSTEISAWDGLVYTLEADKTYEFKATGTKWRLAGFRYIASTTTVTSFTLDESSDNTTLLDENDGQQADVTLTRTLQAGSYNTFAVPFDIDAATLTSTFGSDVKVKELTASTLSGSELTMTFADATTIEAGKPYLIKVSADVENPAFQDVTIHKTPVTTETTYVDFVPTLGVTEVTGTPTDILYLKAGNKLYHPSVLPAQMKGMRGYFVLKGSSAASSFVINIDGETTGIETIANSQEPMANSQYYNLAGRRVAQPTKGLYIVNGKTVIIK